MRRTVWREARGGVDSLSSGSRSPQPLWLSAGGLRAPSKEQLISPRSERPDCDEGDEGSVRRPSFRRSTAFGRRGRGCNLLDESDGRGESVVRGSRWVRDSRLVRRGGSSRDRRTKPRTEVREVCGEMGGGGGGDVCGEVRRNICGGVCGKLGGEVCGKSPLPAPGGWEVSGRNK